MSPNTLDYLPYRERRVLELRFGVRCVPRTREQIGKTFNVPTKRIAKIEEESLAAVRRIVEQRNDPEIQKAAKELDEAVEMCASR